VGIWDREHVHIENGVGTLAGVTENQLALISEISVPCELFHFHKCLFACIFAEI
jgi:hypothetical protein